MSFFVSSLFVPDAERAIVLARRGIFLTRTEVNLDYLDSIKVNTQTGFLSNDAQEEFNFTYQSLLDYVGDTSIKDSFFNPRGTLKSLENKEFPDARVCGNGEIGQPKAPNS